MALVNYPIYLEARTRNQNLGQAPTVIAETKQDDTAKTLLFLGVGLFLGYWLLKKEPKTEKNPHEYVHVKSIDAVLKALEKKNPDDSQALSKAVEEARVVEPEVLPVVESEVKPQAEKNPVSQNLVIVKKVARNKYYGIYRQIEHQHRRGSIRTKKTYSVELLDAKENPIEDVTNRFHFTSLPKAKAYVKELKESHYASKSD